MVEDQHQSGQQRHGSTASSIESHRSEDTVTGYFTAAPLGRGRHSLDDRDQDDRDGQVSPGSIEVGRVPSSFKNALRDRRMPGALGNYRRDLSVLETGGGDLPSISRQPPTAVSPGAPERLWTPNGSSRNLPSSVFPHEFVDDSSDSFTYASNRPSGRGSNAEAFESGPYQDDRRPSTASINTASSSGSKSSIVNFHKKLTGFFGEDYNTTKTSPHGSEISLPQQDKTPKDQQSLSRDRNNSLRRHNSTDDRPPSPTLSRPHTPVPSSEVTPWVYQDPQDIPKYGEAPVNGDVSGPDRQRFVRDRDSASQRGAPPPSAHRNHRLHFPGHRHNKSNEDSAKAASKESSVESKRPKTSREDSSSNLKRLKDAVPAAISSRGHAAPRSGSPTPSVGSGISRELSMTDGPRSAHSSSKRSIFDKLKRRPKDDRDLLTLTSHPGSTQSFHDPFAKTSRHAEGKRRNGTLSGSESPIPVPPTERAKGESHSGRPHLGGKLSRGPKRGQSFDPYVNVDSDSKGASENAPLWNLDLDLSHMEGIVSQPLPQTPPDGGIFIGGPPGAEPTKPEDLGDNAVWDAPDSWAVKRKGEETLQRLREVDDSGLPGLYEGPSSSYCIRVFRVDSTFATLSAGTNSTVAEILQQLGKKSFLQDELDNYQIIMRKQDLQRPLQQSERPVYMQKRLLEQVGYQEKDHIEEIGREDHSYLVRFTFVPTKLSGLYSLDKDSGVSKTQKFSHVDLSGRNLVTIPIALYKRAADIITLNLSRNLALDIPKDFIQGCANLREIRFTSNEAWQLPKSLCLASRLTVLDISNNQLEQLEHADLDRLTTLVSIKMANNKLTSLPPSFGHFISLRSLTVSSNYLETVPECVCNLKSLVDLDLSFNQISELPNAFGELTTLERFWATNNRLRGSFPESFQNLSNLKEIDVRFNCIADITIITKLPRLEQLMAGHNLISVFDGTFPKVRTLHLNHNPITSFNFQSPIPTLTNLNLASAKLNQLDDGFFEKLPNMDKLMLDKNHFVTLNASIGSMKKLQWLSLARNALSNLPTEIGLLTELRILDVRANNLKRLPSEIWGALKLETLNASANLLQYFPKPGSVGSGSLSSDTPTLVQESSLPSSPSFEELGKLEDFQMRRPSQVSSGYLSVGSSPGGQGRKSSVASLHMGRKGSVFSRTASEGTMQTTTNRKDSSFSQRVATTLAGSLRNLYLADNRLNDDVFDELTLLPELRILNLSYNDLFDIPPKALRRWPNLSELYLSGNELSSLPSDDLEEIRSLKVLHLNGNRFQTLPAELGKVSKLSVLDVGSNALKYNVSNWPYDWNWNWNRALKFLNLSGNKRLEIKPNLSYGSSARTEGKDLTDFSSLQNLRVLGLMDVTLTIPSVPDQTEDRRVRTSASTAGPMAYGMADSIGRHEHLSTIDLVVPRLRAEEEHEILLGMFDGQAMSTGGSKVAKFLHENFQYYLTEELKLLKKGEETPVDALRRTYLALHKELGTVANQALEPGGSKASSVSMSHRGSIAAQALSPDDVSSGGVATTLLIQGNELYCANVGDVQAILIHSAGNYKVLTKKHDPADTEERQRIRDAGGYVSRQGKLNDQLEVSRAFGYIQLMPAVMAAPDISHIAIKEQDEMILVASKELWDYLTLDFIVDVARQERGDLMIAAQKLRDLAISFGATGKIMVMMIGVSDLKKRERFRYRGQSISMGPSGFPDEQFFPTKRGKRRDAPDDSTLARLDQEVEAPTGSISMAFTDIKNSTLLWETSPAAMRSAIKIHNSIMRRQLRIIGGYEVKTEGDAFMVSFPTATSALLWCFAVQNELLEAQWPSEILNSIHGEEKLDVDGNRIFLGLSVRMGIHWGNPVCEPDPVTRRMDYFGPMVNRASRISSVADGGQITVSSDFIAEIQKTLSVYAETERTGSTGSEDTLSDDLIGQAIRRELRTLTSQGFEVKEIGERKLKGLENPEQLFLVYPHSLAGRLAVQQTVPDSGPTPKDPATKSKNSKLGLDTQDIWALWQVSLRLEMLCSALEARDDTGLKPPELGLLERMKSAGGEVTDQFILGLVEHHVTRIEACISTLSLRNMLRPFRPGESLLQQACPISDILGEVQQKLMLLESYQGRIST